LPRVSFTPHEGSEDISIEKLKAIKNIIKETALFQFPIPTETNKSIRLMSVFSDGTSGSPLIIKQGKEFKILGILYKGAFWNKALKNNVDGNYTIINSKNADEAFYEAVFLDLTHYNGWINEQLRKFQIASS